MQLYDAIQNFMFVCAKHKNLSKHTLKSYEIDLKQFLQFTGDVSIASVSKNEIYKFHEHILQKGLMPASLKRKLACIRVMFRWFELDEMILSNPFHKVRISTKLPRSLPRSIPTRDVAILLEAARHQVTLLLERAGQNNRGYINSFTALLAIELMVYTGIRVGELVAIELEDIDFEGRRIKILGKGLRERFVFPPDTELVQSIRAYIVARKEFQPVSSKLLISSRGSSASTQLIRKLVRDVSENSALHRVITPHMFRHTAACQLIESGVDIRFVQKLLGHQSILTTQIYTDVNDAVLQARVTEAGVRARIKHG